MAEAKKPINNDWASLVICGDTDEEEDGEEEKSAMATDKGEPSPYYPDLSMVPAPNTNESAPVWEVSQIDDTQSGLLFDATMFSMDGDTLLQEVCSCCVFVDVDKGDAFLKNPLVNLSNTTNVQVEYFGGTHHTVRAALSKSLVPSCKPLFHCPVHKKQKKVVACVKRSGLDDDATKSVWADFVNAFFSERSSQHFQLLFQKYGNMAYPSYHYTEKPFCAELTVIYFPEI